MLIIGNLQLRMLRNNFEHALESRDKGDSHSCGHAIGVIQTLQSVFYEDEDINTFLTQVIDTWIQYKMYPIGTVEEQQARFVELTNRYL